MEELFYTKLWEAIKIFADAIDWFFVVIFMLITWLTIEGVRMLLKKWQLGKTAITVFVLVLGVILASLYAYVYAINDKEGVADLFYSVLAGMVIYKVGIDRLLDFVKSKWNKKP